MRFLIGFVVVSLLVARDAQASQASQEGFFRPAKPKMLVSLAMGVGGIGDREKGVAAGYGAGRVDVQLAPMWLSVAGQAVSTHPAYESIDLRAGPDFSIRPGLAARTAGSPPERAFIRPLLGAKLYTAPLAAGGVLRGTALAGGVDWSAVYLPRWGSDNRVVRGHVHLLFDPAHRAAGFEAETTAGLGVSSNVVGGPFVGVHLGYLTKLGSYGGVDIGVAYEL